MPILHPLRRADTLGRPALPSTTSSGGRTGSVDSTAWQTGRADQSTLLENAVRWVSGGQAPVTVSGDGVAELFAWETEPGYAVHNLNYNNPSLHRGWFRRHYPIGAQRARLEVPAVAAG